MSRYLLIWYKENVYISIFPLALSKFIGIYDKKMNALIIINWKIKSCSLKKSFALQVEFKAAIFSIDVTRVLWKELNFHFNDQLFGIDIKLLLNYIPFNSSCFLTIEYNKVKNAPIQKIDDTVLADTNSRHYILS